MGELSWRARGNVVSVPLKGECLRTIKHAAFALTATAYVRLDLSAGAVRVTLEPKEPTGKTAGGKLAARFIEKFKEETIRSAIEANNRKLREHIIGLALRPEKGSLECEADAGLTEQQQKELDLIIAEVEAEIKKEPRKSSKDPLGVTKTWEETHGRSRCP